MTGYADNDDAARDVDLTIYGGFHASTDDDLPPNTKTVLLLGPNGPDFWDTIHDAPEFSDGQDDPLDRWSTRIIGNLAKSLGAHPVFRLAVRPTNHLSHGPRGRAGAFHRLSDYWCMMKQA